VHTIKLILLIITTLLLLGGCGGGGSSSFENTTSGTTVASCTLPLSSWTTISSGSVVSTTASSQIKFDHDSNGDKKVCVVSGSATVL